MYEAYYNLKHRPFAAAPQASLYFPGAAVEAARSALLRCLQRGEGIGLVIGPAGTGKTLLCQKLATQCSTTWRVAMLACGRLSTRRSLFQAVLYELGQAYRGMDEGELRLALIDFLTLGKDSCQGLALLVDEAHTLPLRLLDEIRLLTNLTRGGQPLVRVLLSGDGALEERLAGPKLSSFLQRIATRCYLESFSRSETVEYIRFQIQSAGAKDRELFSTEACQSVFQATDGVPRLINQLCDHVLLSAYAADRKQIEPADIDEAWSDLQQLPTPWNGAATSSTSNVIEFGHLDEVEEESGNKIKEEEIPALRLAGGLDETDDLARSDMQISKIENLLSEADEDFQPVGTIGPEIELTFAEDPFQEEFAEEEKITDRYAGISPKARPRQFEPIVAQTPITTASTFAGEENWESTSPKDSTAEVELNPSSESTVEEDFSSVPASPPPRRIEPSGRRREFQRLFAKLRHG